MGIKLVLSVIAIVLTLVAFIPYIISILSGMTKPHVFSWVIWGITTFIVFLAQLAAEGGVGAWPIGISGAITLCIAVLAFLKRSDISINRIDWIFFLFASGSLPFWYFTSDPMWAVIVLTIVDLLGFGPTVRKAYEFPHDENMTFFALFLARNICVLLALEKYSIATVLFPLSVGLACVFLLIMVSYRRKAVCV